MTPPGTPWRGGSTSGRLQQQSQQHSAGDERSHTVGASSSCSSHDVSGSQRALSSLVDTAPWPLPVPGRRPRGARRARTAWEGWPSALQGVLSSQQQEPVQQQQPSGVPLPPAQPMLLADADAHQLPPKQQQQPQQQPAAGAVSAASAGKLAAGGSSPRHETSQSSELTCMADSPRAAPAAAHLTSWPSSSTDSDGQPAAAPAPKLLSAPAPLAAMPPASAGAAGPGSTVQLL